jgi:putative transposase
MIQGKIERWHQTVKNRILLENYYLPGDLENQIETFVADYNNCRYHESIDNLIPADVYFGAAKPSCVRKFDRQASNNSDPFMRAASCFSFPAC